MACYLQLQQGGHLNFNAISGSLLLNVCVDNTTILLGGKDYPYSRKFKRYQSANELIDQLVDSFLKDPETQVNEAKVVMPQIDALSIPEIPKADFSLTYEQILDIQRTLSDELTKLYQQDEEERFIVMASSLLL